MSDLKPVRRRAVALTPEGLERLREAIDLRWKSKHPKSKLTRSLQATILGVSPVTLDRILAGEGVDRTTLVHSFKNVELDWQDDLCRPTADEAPSEAAPPGATTEEQPPPGRSGRLRYGLALLGLVVLAFSMLALARRDPPSPPVAQADWIRVYDQALTDARALYDKADYAAARRRLDDAMVIAQEHESLRLTDGAFHIAGDIAAAQGNLTDARRQYEAAAEYRRLRNRPPWPELHESLGIVEMRLDEFEKAGANLKIALEAYRTARRPIGVAQVQRDFGMLALKTGDPDVAEEWFQKSLNGLRNLSQPDLVIDVRGERAMLRLVQNKVDEARRTLKECLEYWRAKGHPRFVALWEMRLGLAEEQAGRVAEASALVARSKAGFQRVGDASRIEESTRHLQRITRSLSGS